MGDSVKFTGAVGGMKKGVITDPCISSQFSFNGNSWQIHCTVMTDFNTSGGDSGGPLINWPNPAYFLGTLTTGGSGYSKFNRWDKIEQEISIFW